jgi:hypothetical protein
VSDFLRRWTNIFSKSLFWSSGLAFLNLKNLFYTQKQHFTHLKVKLIKVLKKLNGIDKSNEKRYNRFRATLARNTTLIHSDWYVGSGIGSLFREIVHIH